MFLYLGNRTKRGGKQENSTIYYRVPAAPSIIMGHTRMATQGSELVNINNHPFPGITGQERFSLAHNGVLTNDKVLRKKFKLPTTKVETDSYVAVQLLEQYGQVNFDFLIGTMVKQRQITEPPIWFLGRPKIF